MLIGLKFFKKKEFVCEVEAILSAITVKWVEEDKEVERRGGVHGGGGREWE
jgi:hypothetical protein